LKYPSLVLDRLAEMTKERIFIQSNIVGGEEQQEFTTRADYERYKDDVFLEDPAFPKCAFVEEKYNGDPTNWWLPNYHALAAMVRSAGLKILARPHPHVVIAEPEIYFGKVVLSKLVFPKYGKKGEPVYPGPQRYSAELWSSLIERSRRGPEE
jgi:hypothetical protein